jgi:hypothetical protein
VEPHAELEELRARVAQLESLVERLAGAAAPPVRRSSAPPQTAGLDRRRMLRNGLGLSAAAVAGVGIVDALGSSAAAGSGDAVLVGQSVAPTNPTDPPTRIFNDSTNDHAAVLFKVDNLTDTTVSMPAGTSAAIVGVAGGHDNDPTKLVGVLGLSDFGVGVKGDSEFDTGVSATSTYGAGIVASSQLGNGVSATSSSGTAIVATNTDGDGMVVSTESGYAVKATTQWADASVLGIAPNGIGVIGNSTSGWGVAGQGKTGVKADGTDVGVDASSDHGVAIKATSMDGTGVTANSTNGSAVVGTSGSAAGIHGVSSIGPGVKAESRTVAIQAISDEGGAISATCSGGTGIDVQNHGPFSGISVNSTHESGNDVGVVSATANHGSAIGGFTDNHRGTQPAGIFVTQGAGPGVEGFSRSGVGGHFIGNRAAIRLFPQKHSGHPQKGKHDVGELLVAADGRLWMCTKSGSPGRWRQIAFV